MKKRGFLIYLILGIFFIPSITFAQQYNRNASVGRSAVMNTSSVYYYTDWKLLSDNSLNSTPIPYSGGDYYHMGSEYSFPLTLVGDTSFRGQVKIPVVANTIYNFQLMNGLGANDMKFGLHQNWGVYGNLADVTVQNSVWECQTYPHLGIAHNYCNYVIDFTFHLSEPWTGAYNLNVAVLDTTGTRSAYYYSGTDSNGNAIEFPVASQNSGYPSLQPSLTMTSTGGSSGDIDDIGGVVDSINSSTDAITTEIQESYENLVKSQEVCSSSTLSYSTLIEHSYLSTNGNPISHSDYSISNYISLPSNATLSISHSSRFYNGSFCFYDAAYSLISCHSIDNTSSIVSPVGTKFFRTTFVSNDNPVISTSFCQNGNQAIADAILDDTIDNFKGTQGLNDIGGQMTTDTPITDLLGLPITLLTAIYSGVNGTCSNFNLGNLWGTNLTMPCINPELYLGTDLWNLIDLLFCGFMIFNIAQLMIHDYSSISSAEDLFDETYTPRHEKMRRS